jgi:hypothetical protein
MQIPIGGRSRSGRGGGGGMYRSRRHASEVSECIRSARRRTELTELALGLLLLLVGPNSDRFGQAFMEHYIGNPCPFSQKQPGCALDGN